jgi:two-component system, LuxR family, sensor kinase FixL
VPVDYQVLGRIQPLLTNRRIAFGLCLAVTAVIACADWIAVPNVSLGLLYCIPMVLAAAHLSSLNIAEMAVVFTLLKESLSPLAWDEDWVPRSVTTLIAFVSLGFLTREIDRRKKELEAHIRELSVKVQLCEAYDQQLNGLVEGSPAPSLTLDRAGRVLMANHAAHHLLRCDPHSLPGQTIDTYLPSLAALRETSRVRQLVRTLIECTGYRQGGAVFQAQVWVSSYGPPDARGMSVVIFDSTEQLRNREEVSLEALATGARVIMGGFWHEIQNLCTAMRLSIGALQRRPDIGQVEEVDALKSLMAAMERLTACGSRTEATETYDLASLRTVLDQLHIVIEPWFLESQMTLQWHEPPDLLLVRADQHGLLHVFLNLARNAHRALEACERKELSVIVTLEGGRVLLRFHNSGLPVAQPEALFRPFQQAATGAGLGLYVSRAIVRSYGGDLRYESVNEGCCFTVVLERADLPFIVQGVRANE